MIKERVRVIAGELTIESNPGQGSRLEISCPAKAGSDAWIIEDLSQYEL